MRTAFLLIILSLLSASLFAQKYQRDEVCSTDTITAAARITKTGELPAHRFVKCSRVSKTGLRIDLGFNTYAYNSNTKNWLGNHNGAVFGLSVAYRELSIGARFKPATVNPKTELAFDGNILPRNADLNPVKIEYDINYSINLKYNISAEPFVAFTSGSFFVINEDELNQHYDIPRSSGLTLGTTINKYIRLKDAEFLAIFARYGYGFTDFTKTHPALGRGYSDISFGVGYKGFFKRKFVRNI